MLLAFIGWPKYTHDHSTHASSSFVDKQRTDIAALQAISESPAMFLIARLENQRVLSPLLDHV